MAKTVLYLWMSSMLLLCACQSDPDLTETEVYSILNEIIVADSLRIHRLCWKFKNLPLYGEHVKVFTEQDKKFIKRQKLLHKGFIIQPNKLKGYSSSRKSFHLVEVDSACDKGIINHLSFPLISIDRQKLVIEITEDCNCLLGGKGGKILYEKINGQWKLSKTFDWWISER
ncbi:hypothetical protein [Haliscomenobacter sp.]|uniref:hypothetical protein n=1 Tax=Haliscomenobacter sp. TaxID=2717303 RepID=UPI003BAD83A5